MSENPFVDPGPSHLNQTASSLSTSPLGGPNNLGPRPNPTNQRSGLLVIGLIVASLFIVCSGFAGLSFVAFRSIANQGVVTELPERESVFEDDASAFNEALRVAKLQVEQGSVDPDSNWDPSVLDFVNAALENEAEDEIPFHSGMFVEAVAKSPWGDNEIGMIERLQIASWIKQYAPLPPRHADYWRVLNVTVRDDQPLAEVDILFYSYSDQATSARWFLVYDEVGDWSAQSIHEPDRWRVYDHAMLEEGRRISDEYAAYARGDIMFADGYESTLLKMNTASELWADGKVDDARKRLRECERASMLPSDRDLAMLKLSYVYYQQEENTEAIRVLASIKNPDAIWGVWPMVALCQTSLGNHDKAIEALKRAQTQSPQHPNHDWLKAEIFAQQDRDDESADARANALKMMARDTGQLTVLADYERVKDIPAMIYAARSAASQNDDQVWERFADNAYYHPDLASASIDAVKALESVPIGMVELLAANAAWARDDHDAAAASYLKVNEIAESELWRRSSKRDWFHVRIGQENYDAILAESKDLDDTLRMLMDYVLEDITISKPANLITAFANRPDVSELPVAQGLIGLAHMLLNENEAAAAKLGFFHEWLEEPEQASDDDISWWNGTVKELLAAAIQETGQTDLVVRRFGDDPYLSIQIGRWMIDNATDAELRSFADRYADGDAMMQLQSLRVKAHLAQRSDDRDTSIKLHQEVVSKADEIAESNDDFYSYFASNERNQYFASLRLLPADLTASNSGDEIAGDLGLRQSMITESERFSDWQLAEAWLADVQRDSSMDVASLANLFTSAVEIHAEAGRWDEAIALCERGLKIAENRQSDSNNNDLSSLQNARILALLAAERFDDARQLLAQSSEPVGYASIDVPAELLADLAEGNLSVLPEHFATEKPDEVANWLISAPRRRLFELQSNNPHFDTLLEAYPMTIGYHGAQQTLRIVVNANLTKLQWHEWGTKNLQSAFSQSLGESVQVRELDNFADKSGWSLTTQSGDSFVVGVSRIAASASDLRGVIDQRAGEYDRESNTIRFDVVTLSVLDYEPLAKQRLFDCVAALTNATQSVVCVAWNDNSRIWIGDNLAERLRWQNKVERDDERLAASIYGYRVDEDGEMIDETESDHHWRQLAGSQANLPVTVQHYCESNVELLPATLIGYDDVSDSFAVRLDQDSAISRYLKADKRCLVQASNLLAKQEAGTPVP
ncbi:tetratricopeptide repeat protein [Rubripirellula amarantea]|nr:tetratricopeptide repeat protein [Rubripirellula amarantea]